MDKDITGIAVEKSPGDQPSEYPYSPRAPTVPLPGPPFELPRLAVHFPILITGLTVVFAVCNVILLPLTRVFQENDYGAVWVYFTGGTILAQAGHDRAKRRHAEAISSCAI